MNNEVKKLTEVAIVGVGCTGFETVSPDVSYKEMMFEVNMLKMLVLDSYWIDRLFAL